MLSLSNPLSVSNMEIDNLTRAVIIGKGFHRRTTFFHYLNFLGVSSYNPKAPIYIDFERS
jgi:hypothetical protein